MAEEPKQEDRDARQGGSVRSIRTILAVSGVILFVIVVLTLLGFVLLWYLDPTNKLSTTERKDLVQGLASVVQALAVLVAGVVGLAGLYFTRRTLLHNQETLRTNQENTQKTLQLTEQGQITERFTHAIDQLGKTDEGKKNLETRLGGIYALERIARDSEDYYWSIIEVLSAYVREHARRQAQGERSEEETRENSSPLTPDIQAILTVLGRRTHYFTVGEVDSINLRGTNLRRAQIREANLAGADLAGADLAGADLRGANLAGCSLEQANFTGAELLRVNLEEASLTGADLTGANLSGANLEHATLTEANFMGAYLRYAKSEEADLSWEPTSRELTSREPTTYAQNRLSRPTETRTHSFQALSQLPRRGARQGEL